ncbi:MAG: hypothetical protein CMC79_03505 [Flavobacteriaceae bacterium]|nr:hypothetical protein [Flavobacteriaceae bacterium]|tara:strand:+ start:10593 stop:11867 length:1275 start_codon:yes stop_codon:yes gene_type:complete
MNTGYILILLPLLVIFSYLFDLVAKRTRFPSVILLMITGIVARFIASLYGFNQVTFLDSLIPVLGTIGLILIVMEGALELDIRKEKTGLIFSGFLAAFLILILNIFFISTFFNIVLSIPNNAAIIYSIPLSIISSAVAIPSAVGLIKKDKEFVVYESTFSDILGIVIFNYSLKQLELNDTLFSLSPIIKLFFQIIGIIIISLIITFFLFKLLQGIEHHVKFFLILAILILVYSIGKIFHFPSLLTIFIFGIFLGNGGQLLPPFLSKSIDVEKTKISLHEFTILTSESTFLVKTFFFLFFGFSITLKSFSSIEPYIYAIIILIIMIGVRYLYFSVSKLSFKPTPILYMSPRGLISILLFLQIGSINNPDLKTTIIDERVLLLVIILSMLAMIYGNLKFKAKDIPFEIETPIEEEELNNSNEQIND